MARYARAMTIETWQRLQDEDETGFEGPRRRRRRARRRQRRQERRAERRGGVRPAPRRGGGGGGAPLARREETVPGGREAQAEPTLPDFIEEELPEEDEEEPEEDLGGPLRRGQRAAGRAAPGGGLLRSRGSAAAGRRVPWAPPIQLGPHLSLRSRTGFRAAVVEVKPGLFVVAEVPETSIDFGLGPLLLAPALVKTLGRAFRRGQAGPDQPGVQQQPPVSPPALPGPAPRQLPGPVAEGDRLARWLDDDVAAELGCAACRRRG